MLMVGQRIKLLWEQNGSHVVGQNFFMRSLLGSSGNLVLDLSSSRQPSLTIVISDHRAGDSFKKRFYGIWSWILDQIYRLSRWSLKYLWCNIYPWDWYKWLTDNDCECYQNVGEIKCEKRTSFFLFWMDINLNYGHNKGKVLKDVKGLKYIYHALEESEDTKMTSFVKKESGPNISPMKFLLSFSWDYPYPL